MQITDNYVARMWQVILQDKIEVAFSNVEVTGNSFETYDKLL